MIYISSFNIGYGPLDFDLVHVEDILNLLTFSSSSLSRENRFKGPIGNTKEFLFRREVHTTLPSVKGLLEPIVITTWMSFPAFRL